VGKYVRKGHVQTTEHWLNERMIPNKLRVNRDEAIRCWSRSDYLEGKIEGSGVCTNEL
jgi:hypothetical protein